jgi:hypothetical protein
MACEMVRDPFCTRKPFRSTLTATISCDLIFLAIMTRPNCPSPRIPQNWKSSMLSFPCNGCGREPPGLSSSIRAAPQGRARHHSAGNGA